MDMTGGVLPINLSQTGSLFCKLSDTHSTLKIRLYWIQFEVVHLTRIFLIFQKFHFSLYHPTQQKIADDYSKNISVHF